MAVLMPGVLFVCCVLCLITTSRCQLQPGQPNVITKHEYYYVTESTSTKSLKSRSTCTRTCSFPVLWWCLSHKDVCKTLYYYVWTSKYKKVKKMRVIYVCKTGWAPVGTGCTKPICSSGCKNGGSCVAPSTCYCPPGWTGDRCSTDVNECTSSMNKCGYKPGCINTQGSYSCSCSSGFYLSPNGRSCLDVNECSSSSQNNCEYKTGCINTPGSYRCTCSLGFYLSGNNRNCLDIDECNPSSGINHGCQMKCNNNIGSYSCSCDKGFTLTSNRRNCSDHNECEGNKHDCEQKCENLPGGYSCVCFVGYRLNSKDFKTCDDINECAENISGCAQNCNNTVGGFNCSCNYAYLLGKDSLSCYDIDECSKPVNHCQHKCINIPGSYICACRQGFSLNYDGKTCTGRSCFPIYKPINGNKNCSGYVTEDSCHFDCLPGYDLTGSKTRTCGPDKQWTGNNTECEIIHCDSPNEPLNGFVYSPCPTHYGSQCSFGCDSGYFAESRALTCDENGFWEPKNVSCNEIKVCEPNPCLHAGICSVVSENQYSCDCTNTGYKGTKCDIGYFNISNYPTVITNEISQPITISCSPPTNQITLHVKSRDLTFAPSALVFNRYTSLYQTIQVTARETGYYLISYSISGPNALEFSLPEEDILFVKSHENSPDDLPNDGLTSIFPYGCYKKQVGVCSGLNLTPIVASSTSPFVSFGPLTATEGLVALEIGNITKIPLSLRGLNLQHTSEESLPDSCNENDVVSYPTESLIKSRALVKTFAEIVDNSLPTWINITLSENKIVQKTQSSDLMTHFLTGIQLQESGVGDGLPLVDDMTYSLLATKHLNVTILNDVDVFQSNQLSLALELCRESPPNIILQPHLQGQKGVLKDIRILKNLRKYGWNFKFDSFQFSKTNTVKMLEKRQFWDGQSFVNLRASPGANFATVTSLTKHFKNLTFADITMEFDGTLIGNVKDINEIIDSPLYEPWNVDLSGKMAFTIVFKMEGKTFKLFVNGPESVGYANFGGELHKELYKKRTGFFFTTILDKDPFLNTTLKNFVDMKTDTNFSCFLDTMLYKEKNRFHHSEKTDSLSCAFHGTLRVGPLRFNTVQVKLQMGKQINTNIAFQNNVQLTGTLGESEDLTFGIFQRDLRSCLNARFLFSQDKPGFSGLFCGICNMFGMKKLVDVSISHEDIKFQVRGKMYNRFDASMNCSSPILPWENQVYEVDGKFERNTGETDFASTLKRGLESYAKNSILQAMKRKEAVDQTVESAHIRLEKILSLKEVALNKLQRLTNDHALAKKQFEMAKRTLESLEIDAKNYSKHIDKLKLDLDNLCNIKQCDEVCQEGVNCTTCYEYITEKSKGMCPATCFRTEQRLVPPYSEVVHCDRQSCKRIHSTNGFFKSVFGGLIGGIVKSVLSFTITVVATVLGAPPPVAGAIGSGVTTLLDTGRVDEALCSASKGFALGSIRGKGLIDKGVKAVASKTISCQRGQRDGRWRCQIVQVKCNKGRYEYEYEHYPYECKKSCVVETIARTIEKICCKSVTCASFVANITCAVENSICKKARIDALERISKTKSGAAKVLKDLEYAKSNVSYWNIKMKKSYNRVLRQQRWVNMTLKLADSLNKAYNSTIESRQQLDKLLSKPLKLMSLFNEQLTSAHGIKMKDIRFTAKVFPGNDNKLLPIDIILEANGTLRQLSTVFDFAKINTSLKSISEEIMLDIIANVFSSSRKKRSVNIPVTKPDILLVSLKKYHTYCAKFTNYHDVLYDLAQSLYNLFYEHLLLQEALSQKDQIAFSVTSLNQTIEGNYSLADYINDLELSETLELRQEEMRQNYESVNSTSKLLIYNWFATVEDMFNSSRMNYECSGMSDCIKHILDSLLQMFSVIEVDGVDHIRQQVKDLGIQLEYLSNSTNTTIEEGLKISSEILSILEKMKEGKVVCAQSPNITKQPEPITETGTGKVLVLNCNASGTALLYSWTFNGETLEGQKSNVLKISNTTVSNSGNYTCVVSNHIAREKSIPAVVIIHPPPIITEQPIEYLAAVLSEDESLQCEVEETSNNVSYQWWFKPDNQPSSFAPLPNETFPYINFSPMKVKDEGWYFCQVSNPYGETTSRISFVKALSFTLPVPTAVLSFSLDKETENINSSRQPSNFTGYEVFNAFIMKHILSGNNSSDPVQVENLRPINCLFGKSKNESNGNVGMCSWEFQYVGRNVTSNVTIDNDFEVNAGLVVNATLELSFTIESLVNATNNDSLSFSMTGNIYFARANSIAIHKYALVCPKSQVLLQKDFKCVDCPPGYHATLGKNEIMTCTACPLGFYQTEAGQTSCNPCPKGFTTGNTGTYKRSECKVICATGQYGRLINETGYCVPCPLNKFQPEEGQFECLPCPNNHVTKMEGATDPSQCISVAKTDQPNSTTETKPTRITERTEGKSTGGTMEKTTTVPHEGEKNESEKTMETWKIGLSGGVFLLLLSGIVVLIYIIRRKRNRKEHSAREIQTERESSSRNDNPVICSFENAIYEEPSLDTKTAEIANVYETPQWDYFNMDDASTSNTSKGDIGKMAFTNPLFQDMSGQTNFNLYS